MDFTRNLALCLVASAQFVVCSASLDIPGTLIADSGSPPLNGIAHVAIRVKDLTASRAFYRKLGFEEAFVFDKEGTPTEAFLKVNDTQFIELYPGKSGQETGFLHVCFESKDIATLNDFYERRGLHPTPVKLAGAGNLLFTMRGPEQQNIEFTQYMPGSRHTLDIGKHLGSSRISDQIIGVAIPMKDVQSASAFYASQMMFPRMNRQNNVEAFQIPGSPAQEIELAPAASNNSTSLILGTPDLNQAATHIRELGIAVRGQTDLLIHDPDGNVIQLRSLPSSRSSVP